jgi:hypothetical protein
VNVFDQDAVVLAGAFAVIMLVSLEAGMWVGRRTASDHPASSGRIDDATMALLGLLLAFSFSAAAAKHEQRKLLAVAEATAIGDLAGSAAMLANPERGKLTEQLRAYLDARIETSHVPLGSSAQAPLLARVRALQAEMTQTVADTVRAGNTPSVHTPLLTTLNAMTTSYENRRAALRDHLPLTVVLMLVLSASTSAFILGRTQGREGARQNLATALFVTLVTLVFFVTLDLEQPRRGIERVTTTALESVRSTL